MRKPDYYCVDCGTVYGWSDDSPDGAVCEYCGGHLRASEEPGKPDMVNSPAHYMHGGIETIELIKAFLTPEEFRGYLKGNVIKYRERAPYKGQMEQDYEKGARYWEWLQAELKGEK